MASVSRAFTSKDDKEYAVKWMNKRTEGCRAFANEHDLWCYTIFRLDQISMNIIEASVVYATERIDIEASYSKTVENLERCNAIYYITNNFDDKGHTGSEISILDALKVEE